jgi:inositol transport system substrate-binding protein
VERRCSWKQEFFDKRLDVTIVAEQSGHGNTDEGIRCMEDWVQANLQINAVVSMITTESQSQLYTRFWGF